MKIDLGTDLSRSILTHVQTLQPSYMEHLSVTSNLLRPEVLKLCNLRPRRICLGLPYYYDSYIQDRLL